MKHSISAHSLKHTFSVFFIFALLFRITYGNPSGSSVVSGQAVMTGGPGQLTVSTGTDKTIIHWQDFSIGIGESTSFLQPGSDSAVLNRVTGGSASDLNGLLQSNGKVYLINPNGVVIGASGRIETASFIASTLDVSNEEFLSGGDMVFRGSSDAKVVNLGKITGSGDIILIARQVENHGTMRSSKGMVALAAGSEILIKQTGDERVFVKAGSANGSVVNTGTIEGVTAEIKAAGNVYGLAVNNSGMIRATGSATRGGRVYLTAQNGTILNTGKIEAHGPGARVEMHAPRIDQKGQVFVSGASGSVFFSGQEIIHEGRVDVTGDIAGEINIIGGMVQMSDSQLNARGPTGGVVKILGEEISMSRTQVDVSGESGDGGIILIGGNYQGDGPEKNAVNTKTDAATVLIADAGLNGNGGTIIVWADRKTEFYGKVQARGGTTAGDGGFAEVSGHHHLLFRGQADLTAQHGSQGTLLLDPTILTITGGAGDGGVDGNTVVPATIAYADALSTVYESELEAFTGASLILRAAREISVTGTFGNGDILFQPNVSVTLQTRNNSTDGSGFIDLTSSTHGTAFTLETQGTGNIVLTGGVAISANSAQVRVSKLITAGGGITLSAPNTASRIYFNNDIQSFKGVSSAGNISVSGDVLLNTAISISADSTATDGSILFSRTINSSGGARNLTLNSGSQGMTLGGVIGGTSALNDFLISSTGTSALSLSAITANSFVVGASTSIDVGGAISVTGPTAVGLTSTGAINVNNAITTTGTGGINFNNAGAATVLRANVTTEGGNMTFAGNMTVDGTVTLTTAGGNLSITGTVGSGATSGALAVVAGTGDVSLASAVSHNNAITLSGRDVTLANVTLTAGNGLTINNSRNTLLAGVSRGAGVTVNSTGNITVGGSWAGGTTASSVTLVSSAGAINLNAGTTFTASGIGNNVTLSGNTAFVNNAGAGALVMGGGARYFVYSPSPALTTQGGLAFDFEQFSSPYPTAPASAGSGFLYASAAPVVIVPGSTLSSALGGNANRSTTVLLSDVSGQLTSFSSGYDRFSRYGYWAAHIFDSPQYPFKTQILSQEGDEYRRNRYSYLEGIINESSFTVLGEN